MNEPQNIRGNVIYYRLIALWFLCEAIMGGIIHAAKIPVSGLIVGSCVVVCICLIAFYNPAKGAIKKMFFQLEDLSLAKKLLKKRSAF